MYNKKIKNDDFCIVNIKQTIIFFYFSKRTHLERAKS